MNMYILSIVLIVLSNVFYHLSQKGINNTINPFFSLSLTYGVGIVISFGAWLLTAKERSIAVELSNTNIFTLLLGIAIVGLETGFLLAYRANWPMPVVVILTNVIVTMLLMPIGIRSIVIVTMLLIPIGILFFHELINVKIIAGILLCLIGLGLITV